MSYPQVGDKVMTRFGDTGTIIAFVSERSSAYRSPPYHGYLYEGNVYFGPYIIRLEGGTVVGLKYDEFKRI
jgi:hypothetical protein